MLSRKTVILIAFVLVAHAANSALASGTYWIEVKAHTTSAFVVEGDVTTNLPQAPELAIVLELVGQRATETFIGTNFIRVRVENGHAHFVIDAKENAAPVHSTVPAGLYDVVATFENSQNWEANWKLSGELDIRGNIEGRTRLALSAAGAPSSEARRLQEGRQWVESNIVSGSAWKPADWQKRFGASEAVAYRGGLNPGIINVRYYPSIDISVLFNIKKSTVVTWRQGRVDR